MTGGRLVFSGQPEVNGCRGFCGEKMIGHDTWIVKREWVGKDGGTSKEMSILELRERRRFARLRDYRVAGRKNHDGM